MLRANPLIHLTPLQLLGFVANTGLVPGHGYDYSDSDNIVVGLMIEAVTGKSYQVALADEVTNPSHLARTFLPSDVGLPVPYVHGYDVTPGVPPLDVSMFLNPALAWASGGMLSTPSELNTFMRAYVRGAFTSAATRKKQFTFVAGNSGPPAPAPMRQASASSGIARRVELSTATPGTSPATPSSPQPPAMEGGRWK